MRKLYSTLTLIVAVLLAATQMKAQTCVPDLTLPDSVLVSPMPYTDANPGAGIADTACVGDYYETVIQFQIPPILSYNGLMLPINSVDLATSGAIVNLPTSMNYTCNPPNCVFQKDSTGCIVMYGTPVADDAGVHNLQIAITVQVGIPFPFVLPDGNLVSGNYFMHVKTAEDCLASNATDLTAQGFQFKVQPNPLQDRGMLQIQSPEAGNFSLRLFDAMGRPVWQDRVNLQQGENQVELDVAALPAGIYVYQLASGQRTASGRFLVQR